MQALNTLILRAVDKKECLHILSIALKSALAAPRRLLTSAAISTVTPAKEMITGGVGGSNDCISCNHSFFFNPAQK